MLKPHRIEDTYFGEMGVLYDKYNKGYYLQTYIMLDGIERPVVLYLESSDQRSTKNQQDAFKVIKVDFSKIFENICDYLTIKEKLITIEQFGKEYRLESITIAENITTDSNEWEMNLLNLKDGFSKIVIELRDDKPIHFSVEG